MKWRKILLFNINNGEQRARNVTMKMHYPRPLPTPKKDDISFYGFFFV